MNNPKEEAKRLVEKFLKSQIQGLNKEGISVYEVVEEKTAKQCALICVEEILKTTEAYYFKDGEKVTHHPPKWQQVKKEIESL